MNNPIKQIYQFNKEAGLLENGYSDFLECSMSIEESLEGLNIDYADTGFCEDPKELSRSIVSRLDIVELTDVDRLDKHVDNIIINFGSIFKLGLTPQQAGRAVEIVMQHNQQKLGMGKDEHGKLIKPEGFTNPEPELQKLLDKRGD